MLAESFLETICMVLNNHDSNKNPILTVVPLTSSRSKFNVHIEEDLLPLVLEKWT